MGEEGTSSCLSPTLTYYANLNGFVLSLAVLLKKFHEAFASKTFSGS